MTTSSPAPQDPSVVAMRRRSAARLAAIQSLYSRDMQEDKPVFSPEDLAGHHISDEYDGHELVKPDLALMNQLVSGVSEQMEKIDELMVQHLNESWPIHRLDPVLRSILRAGIFELLYVPKTPIKVVIHEYVSLAKAFFDETEVGFVNGILDAVGQKARQEDNE